MNDDEVLDDLRTSDIKQLGKFLRIKNKHAMPMLKMNDDRLVIDMSSANRALSIQNQRVRDK